MRTPIAAVTAAALTCALAPAAGAAVATPTSGWYWGNPRPQGNLVDRLAFAGARGYAVGLDGTALRTDDGGTTWSGLHTGVGRSLHALSVPAQDVVFLGGGCLARRSLDGGATFRRVRFTPSEARCRSALSDLSFVDADRGFVVTANGAVQFTADGGDSFAARTAVPGSSAAGGNAAPTRLRFVSATVGFATTSAGGLFQTVDGGNSWVQRATSSGRLDDVVFPDAATGYAVGADSAVWATSDGGATWARRPAAGATPRLELSDVACASASTCVAVARDRNVVLRTSDGWGNVQETTPAPGALAAVGFASAARVVAAGAAGATRVSDDAGATFAPVGGTLGIEFERLRRGPGALAYAPGEDGTVGVSGDAGSTWSAMRVPTADDVIDVAFPTPGLGYAADTGGLVLKTANAGATWTQLDAGTGRTTAILAPRSNLVLLLGTGIRRSTDGETFARLPGLAGRAALLDGDRAGGTLFAWGRGTILASTDGGRRWVAVRKPGPRLTIRSVDFVTSTVGFLTDTAGRFYRTTDRGRRWVELLGLGRDDGYDVSFADARTGWVSLAGPEGGAVARTTDGGRSFAPQVVDPGGATSPGWGWLLATGRDSALLVTSREGRTSRLFGTTNGGRAGAPSALTLTASPRRLARPGIVTVRGRLRPASGGELVRLAAFDLRLGRWTTRFVSVASNGAFSGTYRLGRATGFVAQWTGDAARAGDGSPPLVVRVGR